MRPESARSAVERVTLPVGVCPMLGAVTAPVAIAKLNSSERIRRTIDMRDVAGAEVI